MTWLQSPMKIHIDFAGDADETLTYPAAIVRVENPEAGTMSAANFHGFMLRWGYVFFDCHLAHDGLGERTDTEYWEYRRLDLAM